ncbi:hypothetical protein GLOTRDRAFT_78624 [Gloeophyllum trabeum ATCC 11539]|uniref:Oxidized purine nucleoside triphosphate hydrolase n=1 Tax=Gloeophyllum trabeum (strain ATCC 11539 / FP-39264 / Madison 617) TaxID=670483 RepID=S7Q239_GLOTA|nr:uncharacterized protein GLOTRDRAFT_78624 [Gloeophyllum trabeum ATCC 11539]EPQ53597.1 hypothetical protein GLOTRDRAFT_78624 [Gloeophyllum trabeum ATCC 11539]
MGMKKRGFGKDKYNGFGGKVEGGETSAEAALRELQEEAGITAPLQHSGAMLFVSEGVEAAFHIDYYAASTYEGAITETEEMRPEWFAVPNQYASGDANHSATLPAIPFDRMWEADKIWFPLFLSRKKFNGRVDFRLDESGQHRLQRWWFGTLAES